MNNSYKKVYPLRDRAFLFAEAVRIFVTTLPKSVVYSSDCEQLIRSSGSVGANYIEANDALGKQNFIMHMRISRKEAKESQYWLRLLQVPSSFQKERARLEQEAKELLYILSSILKKFE